MIDILIPTIAQGLLWALLSLGVYITFRVLDIADLSVEGSFPLGAAVAASALVAGLGLIPAFILATVAGALAGVVTGFLTTKLKIPALLAGILTMGTLLLLQIPYADYNEGGSIITLFLSPATACLAVSIYHKIQLLKKNWLPVLVGCAVGSLTSMGSIFTVSCSNPGKSIRRRI